MLVGSQMTSMWKGLMEQLGITNKFVVEHGLLVLAILLGVILFGMIIF